MVSLNFRSFRTRNEIRRCLQWWGTGKSKGCVLDDSYYRQRVPDKDDGESRDSEMPQQRLQKGARLREHTGCDRHF